MEYSDNDPSEHWCYTVFDPKTGDVIDRVTDPQLGYKAYGNNVVILKTG